MYTVMIADDGMFSAEYVVPPALSIPLGASGSAVDVVRNEDGTFSADGEVITAETRVTAENGNVYRAILSPAGVPVGVDHVPAMQDVMLGDLGGTVKLTQAEDKSWWLGEMAVMDGYVHTHENGNMYMLMMDAEGMWSAMYQKVEVMVGLGTQGSVTLVRAEDMSWWLGSEAVDVGSEVMSESGNTYTLRYTDGAWSTDFVPESMMIEGTGLVAMTKEDRSGYDVDGEDLPGALPTLGTDIDTSMGSYRVTMMDGKLMGVRLDAVTLDTDTDYSTLGLRALPAIPGDEDDTPDVNEAKTALKLGKDGDLYTFSNLLPDGMSERQGPNYVAVAKAKLEQIRGSLEAVLEVFAPNERQAQVDRLWGTGETRAKDNVKETLDDVFGNAGITDPPEHDAALGKIDDLIMALSTVDALASALDDDGALMGAMTNDKSAQAIFDATEWQSSVSYGMTGNTRYGAIIKKTRTNATSGTDHVYDSDSSTDGQQGQMGELGAFAFGTTPQTDRLHYVATTGNARYSGETLAVGGDGTHYSGDIDIQVRFATRKVAGLITRLQSGSGEPWTYQFGAVDAIVLPTMTADTLGRWGNTTGTNATKGNASVTYERRAGSPIPLPVANSTFQGRLLGGNGADAGSEAVGVWSVGDNPDDNDYLAGGYGAIRVAYELDKPLITDDGTEVEAKIMSADEMGSGDERYAKTELSDGTLKITVAKYGWEASGPVNTDETINNPTWTWGRLNTDNGDDDEDPDDGTRSYEISLSNLVAGEGAEINENGSVYVTMAREKIQKLRDQLAVLIDTGLVESKQRDLWHEVQKVLLEYVFQADLALFDPGDSTEFYDRLPQGVRGPYEKDAALERVDRILHALSSNDNLEEALDPDEDGLFVRSDNNQPLGRPYNEVWAEKDSQVKTWIGTTSYTRFGTWRVRRSYNAQRSIDSDVVPPKDRHWQDAEIDAFAYSPLPQSKITSTSSPNYPAGATANYVGKTVAFARGAPANGASAPQTGYEGDVNVRVRWNPAGENSTVGATVQTVISDLQQIHGDPYSNGGEVRELVLPEVTMTAAADGTLGFSLQSSEAVTIVYVDRTTNTSGLTLETHMGEFVGSSADGPLGVMGTYSTGSAVGDLTGAYGADLP